MKILLAIAGIAIMGAGIGFRLKGQSTPGAGEPHYLSGNRMARPGNYREWIWLSSGLGMSYGPLADGMRGDDPPFDNVFVQPAAYRSFIKTGKWPDKTILVLELRASASKASINQSGHFQGELLDIEVHVKDESRFPGKWAFYGFGRSEESATMIPTSASCYSCHEQHGAVDTTFVQFYPTLLEIAKQKKTVKEY